MDRGAWQAIVQGSQGLDTTQRPNHHHHIYSDFSQTPVFSLENLVILGFTKLKDIIIKGILLQTKFIADISLCQKAEILIASEKCPFDRQLTGLKYRCFTVLVIYFFRYLICNIVILLNRASNVPFKLSLSFLTHH